VPDPDPSNPKAKRWCLPDSTVERRVQLKRLDHVIDQLKAVQGIGASGPELHIPLQIIYFKSIILLNPRVVSKSDASYCYVMKHEERVRVEYHKTMRVEYESTLGGVYQLDVDNEESCAMVYLLKTL
jgi:peptide deformylase